MIEKKFVFAVKLEETKNIYEVFDIMIITDEHPDRLDKWSKGFANNDVKVIDVSSLSPRPKTINNGSFWNGKEFISKDNINEVEISDNFTLHAYLDSDNTVFALHAIKKIDQFYNEKWQAALTSEVVGIDATNYPEVILGHLWDGNNFYPPLNN